MSVNVSVCAMYVSVCECECECVCAITLGKHKLSQHKPSSPPLSPRKDTRLESS